MRVSSFGDADTFLKEAGHFLQAAPRRNTVILSVVEGLRGKSAHDSRFMAIEREGQVVGAAMHSPPFRLFLAAGHDGATRALVKWLVGTGLVIPGVVGPDAAASAFQELWCAEKTLVARKAKALHLYSLETLVPQVVKPPGRARRAQPEESDLLQEWASRFASETRLPPRQAIRIGTEVSEMVLAGRIFVWESEGEPRAMVTHSVAGLAPGRIQHVYVPPSQRGRGYGAAVLHDVCGHLLRDLGWRYCVLFAEVEGEAANRLYRRTGFSLVDRFQEYDFVQSHRFVDPQ